MKKRIFLTLSTAVALLFTNVAAAGFTDIDSHDAALNAAIEDTVSLGIAKGYEDSTFKPDALVTRAEMAEFCVRLLPPADASTVVYLGDSHFADMNGKHWAATAMYTMVNMEYMQGYGDNTVKPDANITMSEASAIITRMLGYDAQAALTGGYPNGYLRVMDNLGITDSLENIGADEPMTRGAIVKMLHKALDAPMLMISEYSLTEGATYVQDSEHTYRNLLKNYN